MPTAAMRLSGVDEFATLACASVAKLDGRQCTAPAGSTVRIIGRPASPGDKAPNRMLFVRFLDGPCLGFEATLDERTLRDFRESQ